jgi:hypothetical protein
LGDRPGGLGITREDFSRSRSQALAVGTLSVLLAVAAIGSGIITGALDEEEGEEEAAGPAAGEAGARTLRLSADPGGELRFDKGSLEAREGQVTIAMANPSSVAWGLKGGVARSIKAAAAAAGALICGVVVRRGRPRAGGHEAGGGRRGIDRPRRRRLLRRGPEDRAPDREPSRTAETGRRE